MSPVRAARACAALLALSAFVALLSGCSREAIPLLPNVRPTIEVTQAPVNANQPFFYGYELRWAGYDVDGSIDHFRYAIDPPTQLGAETTWVKTGENRKSFLFHADSVTSGTDLTAEGYHTIVLEAVDDRGTASAPVSRSLTSFTVAPTVQVVQPPPNQFFPYQSGPSIRVRWVGNDPDGRGTSKPVKYKYRLFSETDQDFGFDTVLGDSDSVRRRFGPRFSEWDSVGGDTTAVEFVNMRQGKHVVGVVAFDEAGAYSPVMTQLTNMLYFTVDYKGFAGPQMVVYNESIYYDYGSGGFYDSPDSYIRTEAAAGRPLRFNWFGKTKPGTFVSGYRWMLDGNINDETPRSDENAEFKRWSRWSPLTTSVELPAFNPPAFAETHNLFIEATDNNAQVSLAVVQFTVVRAVFDRDLLVVDDTRLRGDVPKAGGCMEQPRNYPWPTSAELDTFFFARGGVPWKCYPAGTLSHAGIFSGYEYDTLGTRFLPQGTLTLQKLSRYRHVVWYTDSKAARYINDPYLTTDPMSELRWLTTPGRSNPIGTWISQGGQIWMFGGGAASALQANGDKTPFDIYSNSEGELVPGKFMYDVFGWRSEITARTFSQATKPPHPIARSTSPFDYSSLPDLLLEKQPETDDLSIFAPGRNYSDFYRQSNAGEGISKPNLVVEDLDPSPGVRLDASVLDTLYQSIGGNLGSDKPVMTVYYGGKTGQIQVFSGFELWYWQRDQQIQILDWVLQKAWNLPRNNVPR